MRYKFWEYDKNIHLYQGASVFFKCYSWNLGSVFPFFLYTRSKMSFCVRVHFTKWGKGFNKGGNGFHLFFFNKQAIRLCWIVGKRSHHRDQLFKILLYCLKFYTKNIRKTYVTLNLYYYKCIVDARTSITFKTFLLVGRLKKGSMGWKVIHSYII